MPADLRAEDREEEKEEAVEEEENSERREIRKRRANVWLIKAGGNALGREGMKARQQQKRKLTDDVKALTDSLLV